MHVPWSFSIAVLATICSSVEERDNHVIRVRRTVARFAGIMAMLGLAVLSPGAPSRAAETTERVIVTLRMPIADRAFSLDATQASSRRVRIAQTQQQTLQRHPALAQHDVQPLTSMPVLITDATSEQIAALRADPAVASVHISRLFAPTLSESTTHIGARVTHAAGYAGAGTSIAILDTGVAKSHPFLAGSVVQEACFSTRSSRYNSIPLCPDATERSTAVDSALPCPDGLNGCNHGTHVAGIAAGRVTTVDGVSMSGVAPAAKLIAVQVYSRFDYTNSERVCGVDATQDCVLAFESDVLAALDYLATNIGSPGWGTLAAVNLSMGVDPSATPCDTEVVDGWGLYKTYVDALRSLGVATVVSAGNDANTAGVSHPGCISSAVTVGSTRSPRADLSLLDTVSTFSNAPATSVNTPNGQTDRLLDMLAPGEPIRSSMAYPAGSYADLSGTSMAAPHVAGAWAVLKGILPAASVTDIQQTLRVTGQPISDTRVTSQPALVLPRIALNDAVALLRTASLPLGITPNGIEFGAVQRGTSAVGRITIQYTGVPVRIVRTAVSAPWVVTPLGCGTIIDDIADRCVYEVRYAPTSAAPLGWNATSIAVTLNGVRTLIGLSAQTVAVLPPTAATQTAQVAAARLTQTPTLTPSATPLSHALALTHIANATRTFRRAATTTAAQAASATAWGITATAEATTGAPTYTATPTATASVTGTIRSGTKTIAAARTATQRRVVGLTQTSQRIRTATAAVNQTAHSLRESATADVANGSPSHTRTRTATPNRTAYTATATRTNTRGPTLTPTVAILSAQSTVANARYQRMVVRNTGTVAVLVHQGNRLGNDTPLVTLVRLSDLRFGTGVALDGQTATALCADPRSQDKLYIAGRLDWQTGYIQAVSVATGRVTILGTTVFSLPAGSDVRTIQAIGTRLWVGVARAVGPAALLSGELHGFDVSSARAMLPLPNGSLTVAAIPQVIIPIEDSDDRIVIAGRVDQHSADTGFLQVVLRTGDAWGTRPAVYASAPFNDGAVTYMLQGDERTPLLSIVDGARIALYTLSPEHTFIYRSADVRTPASAITSDGDSVAALGYTIADRKNVVTVYHRVDDTLILRRRAALTNTAGGIAGLSASTPWLYLLDALRLSRTPWP